MGAPEGIQIYRDRRGRDMDRCGGSQWSWGIRRFKGFLQPLYGSRVKREEDAKEISENSLFAAQSSFSYFFRDLLKKT